MAETWSFMVDSIDSLLLLRVGNLPTPTTYQPTNSHLKESDMTSDFHTYYWWL